MENLTKITAEQLSGNMADKIAKQWMLISAGDSDKCNTMTASWGFMGFYANKYCAAIVVRPERYTYQFLENSEFFTLSFFSETYRKSLSILGVKSGRDGDKITEAGLTTQFTPFGNPTFKEAELVVECRKIYASMMERDNFVDKMILDKWYGGGHGLHKLYVGEIVNVWAK